MSLDYLKEPGMLETTEMKRLAIEEGIFCGRSTGLNVVGAINIACEIGSGRRAVTLGCDTGSKYLGGHIYP